MTHYYYSLLLLSIDFEAYIHPWATRHTAAASRYFQHRTRLAVIITLWAREMPDAAATSIKEGSPRSVEPSYYYVGIRLSISNNRLATTHNRHVCLLPASDHSPTFFFPFLVRYGGTSLAAVYTDNRPLTAHHMLTDNIPFGCHLYVQRVYQRFVCLSYRIVSPSDARGDMISKRAESFWRQQQSAKNYVYMMPAKSKLSEAELGS